MSNFNERLTAPSHDNKYYYENNIFYNSGYGMPNCTAYAWGRFYELSGKKPNLSINNAEDWYDYNDGYKRGKIPKLGAVIVWSKGNKRNGNDGSGHVAIVEKIYDDGSILTSNSAYHGTNFYTQRICKTYKLYDYTFEGFIYNPIEFIKSDNKERTKSLQKELNKYKANLVVDGIIGTKTTSAIKKFYNKHYIIKWVQLNLNNLGYNCGTPDGISGTKTTSAIKKFQQDNNLKVDGIAGINTIKSICNF